jgi:hypothetical protein
MSTAKCINNSLLQLLFCYYIIKKYKKYYMLLSEHFHGLVQALQYKVVGLNSFVRQNLFSWWNDGVMLSTCE